MLLSGNSSISQASKKRIWCFQCQINVRPEQKQHEQKVFFNFPNKKWTLQPRFSRYSIWVLNSHGFQHKLENLMPSRTEIFHPSWMHRIQAGTTDGERQEKMLLLLLHLNWDALGHTALKAWSKGVLSSFLPNILCSYSEKQESFY